MNYSEDQYAQLLGELYNRHPSVQTAGFAAGAYKPGLDAMRRFDAALGHPSQQIRTLHVAGTNGKGSVCSMLAAALSATGLRVGLYTSPHLVDFRERIKLVGPDGWSMVPKEYVFRFLTERDLGDLSFFEITTGLAFRWFADEQVDIAVIEVGLGGRLDSTNILSPELAVVTSIGLDHCALLGSTRAAIAGEKAGIFKPGVPALCGQCDAETAPVFEAHAAAAPCPLFYAADFDTESFGTDLALRPLNALLATGTTGAFRTHRTDRANLALWPLKSALATDTLRSDRTLDTLYTLRSLLARQTRFAPVTFVSLETVTPFQSQRGSAVINERLSIGRTGR